MCGIAGIIGNAPEINSSIERMSRAVAHRGPDDADCAIWQSACGSRAAFAHRRLSIIDLSQSGRQPMTTADGRYSIIFNGEIYNYLDLRKSAANEGIEFVTNTDTEVVLRLYEKQGAECLRHLRGMFALAVRDNETGEVFAARDRLGIKPFYYHAGNDRFIFASEIRALLASRLIAPVLDPVSLNSYLSFGAVQEPRTIIEGVRALAPAHYIRVGADGKVKAIARYWSLPETKHKIDRATAVAETRSRLEESVRLHLVADVPLGAFLSSGIDSSSVVALMSRHAPGRVKTFTVCFEEQEFSERDMARRVAAKFGARHTEIKLAEDEMLALLPSAFADMDQPSIDGINTWFISRAAKHAGITVALSGLGGDELFGGYPSFQRALRAQKLGLPLRLVGGAARRQVAAMAATLMGDSVQSQKLGAAIRAGTDTLALYACMRGLFARGERMALANNRAECRISSDSFYDIPDETLGLIEDHAANGDVFNRISHYELSLYMANMLLRDTDAMSMASALEVRVPLIDHELVEWVYALPGHLKLGRQKKALLVEAMGDDLLPEVVNHKKMGFLLPFDRWLRTALRGFVSDTLGERDGVKRAGLNYGAVADVVKRFDENSRSTSWSRVWGLAVLVDWCRRHQVEVAA